MKANKLIFLNLFMMDAIVHIFTMAANIEPVGTITKILLMPLLALHVLFNFRKNISRVFILLAALFFSWLGDIFLLYSSDLYFMLGLGAFLIAQVIYIFAFSTYSNKTLKSKMQGRPYLYAPYILYAIVLCVLIWKGLGSMEVPVILYACAITGMALSALRRWGRTDFYSFIFTLSGATLFIISDSLIAVNKFYTSVPFAPTLIIFTYVIAQYLIVNGCLLHIENEVKEQEVY